MANFAEIFGEDGKAKKLWNSSAVGLPLWLAGAGFTIYWLYLVPPPGYAVGALVLWRAFSIIWEINFLAR